MKTLAMALLFVVCAAQVLSAQEFRFGAQGSIALPMGDAGGNDFLNHRPGLGLGLHGLWNFQPGQALVPRIDVTLYRWDIGGNSIIPYKKAFTLKDIKVGADYNYAFSNPDIYGIAGLGYSSFEWPISKATAPDRESKGAIYFSLGVGYRLLEHFLAEFRYTYASYSDVGSSSGFIGERLTAPAVSLSLLWRY